MQVLWSLFQLLLLILAAGGVTYIAFWGIKALRSYLSGDDE